MLNFFRRLLTRKAPEESLRGPFTKDSVFKKNYETADAITTETRHIYFLWSSAELPEWAGVDYHLVATDPTPFLPLNSVISSSSEKVAKPSESTLFSFDNSQPWPPGTWRAEVRYGERVVHQIEFEITGDPPEKLAFVYPDEMVTAETKTLQIKYYHPFCKLREKLDFKLVAVDIEPWAANRTVLAQTSTMATETIATGQLQFPEEIGFPPGKYRVEGWHGDNLFGSFEFEVTGAAPKLAFGPVFQKVAGPTEQTDVVKTDSQRFYVTWGAPFYESAGPLTGSLITIEVEGLESETEIATHSTTPEFSYGFFEFNKSDSGWLPGRYRVDILRADNVIGYVEFTVQE